MAVGRREETAGVLRLRFQEGISRSKEVRDGERVVELWKPGTCTQRYNASQAGVSPAGSMTHSPQVPRLLLGWGVCTGDNL